MASLGKLVKSASPDQTKWSGYIDPSIRPAAGVINTLTIWRLAAFCRLGTSKWKGQFAAGFSITGDLSQAKVPPARTRRSGCFPRKGYSSRLKRIRERAPKSGLENANDLWKEAMCQHSKGWLAAPVELKASGRPADLPTGGYNIAFRFGVEQAEKLRACDDLKHGLTNQACRVHTPIRLVSWDHLSQLCRTFARDGRDWALFKADHEAAYKQLPMDPADQLFAIIALRHPTSGIWHGFRSRTLVFGSIAAVIHYNVFSRLITAIFNKTFGIPLICFFDDFAALLPRLLARKGMAVFTGFCNILGIKLKSDKSELGPEVTFLGLQGTYPAKETGSILRICLPAEKKKAWSALTLSYLPQGRLSYQELKN